MYRRRQQHSLICLRSVFSCGFFQLVFWGFCCKFFVLVWVLCLFSLNINLCFSFFIDLGKRSWVNSFLENPLRDENGRKDFLKEPWLDRCGCQHFLSCLFGLSNQMVKPKQFVWTNEIAVANPLLTDNSVEHRLMPHRKNWLERTWQVHLQ